MQICKFTYKIAATLKKKINNLMQSADKTQLSRVVH